MGFGSMDLWERCSRYADLHGRVIKEDERFKVGSGQDGSVWATTTNTAIKVLNFEPLYERERSAYFRLLEHDVSNVMGCDVPRLMDYDDELWVVEMTIVTRPFVLDFAGAYLDVPPAYSPEMIEEWEREKAELFEDDWPKIKAIRAAFRAFGIYLTDLTPNNIALHP